VQPLDFLVEPARRPEVGQPEFAAGVFEAVAQYVQRPAPRDLPGETLEELIFHRPVVVLFEPFPFLGLRRYDEVDDVARDEAQRSIIFFRPPLPKAARREFAIRRPLFADPGTLADAGIRPISEQPVLDGFFKASFRDFHRLPPFLSTALRPAKQNQIFSLHGKQEAEA